MVFFFFLLGEKSPREGGKKKKSNGCLQDEAGLSGSWICGDQCAGLQRVQRM